MKDNSEIYITVSAPDGTGVHREKATRPAGENSIERALGISPAEDRRRRGKFTCSGHAYVDRRQATELRQLILIGSLLAAYCRGLGVDALLTRDGIDANALAIAWDDLLPAVRGTLIAAESR